MLRVFVVLLSRRSHASSSVSAPSPDQNVFVKIAAGNSLYENTGQGYFRDVTVEAGPFPGSWGWGGGFFDFDNDGWEDIYTPNGYVSNSLMRDT